MGAQITCMVTVSITLLSISPLMVDGLGVWIRSRRGGGHSLIWPKRVGAAQQGMVFRVLHLKQGIQFHYSAS